MSARRIAAAAALLLTAACATGGSAWWAGPDPGYDGADDARRVWAGLSNLRKENRRGPTVPFMVGNLHLSSAAKEVAGGRDPEVAVERAVEKVASEGERDLSYWMLKADRLEELQPPSDLLRPPRLALAVAVFRQLEGKHPRYMVAIVTSSLREHEEPR